MKPTNCHDEENCCEDLDVTCEKDECVCEEEDNCKLECEEEQDLEKSCCGGECCLDQINNKLIKEILVRVNLIQIIWETLTYLIKETLGKVADLILGILGKVKWILKKILPF